jgi:hypothetical protein
MTPAELLYNFKIGFDVISSGAAPGFTDGEIYSLLNRGQDYLILDLYKQKELKLLQSLIKESTTTLTLASNIYSGSLPLDYWLLYNVSTTVTRTSLTSTGFIPTHTNVSGVVLDCDIVDPKEALQFLPSSFNSLRIWKNPKVYLETNNINIIVDDYTTITDNKVIYIKKRLDISGAQTCELQESLHRLVVDKAIDIAKTIINIQEPQASKQS